KALKQAGYNVDVVPTEWNSEGLLNTFEFQNVKNKKIAIIRGKGGREVLDKTLREHGANVLNVIVYERILPDVDEEEVSSVFNQTIDAIVCTSYEAVKNLKLLASVSWKDLQTIPLIVIS